MTDAIILGGVKTHNLKNLDLVLPHKKFYVVTGVSGSGKSSLAFDTLYAEGQRRYVESMSSYARQFLERIEKPEIESASGIPPALAIEAKNTVNNARSTVGTQTEINDYLRVLYSRIGRVVCPECRKDVVSNHPQSISQFLFQDCPDLSCSILFKVELTKRAQSFLKEAVDELVRQGFSEFWAGGKHYFAEDLPVEKIAKKNELYVCVDRLKIREKSAKRLLDSIELAGRYGQGKISAAVGDKFYQFSEGLSCVTCAKSFREPVPNLFSFNSPLGACESCQGFGRIITIDQNLVVPDDNKSLADGAIEPWTKPSSAAEMRQLLKFAKKHKIPTETPWHKLSKKHKKFVLEGDEKSDYFSVKDFFDYLQRKTYKMHVRVFLAKYRGFEDCPTCHATRLKSDALNVFVEGKNIAEVLDLNLDALYQFLRDLKLTEDQKSRSESVYLEILNRVRFLNEVGLNYLTLSRLSRTLSGGEVQRIHLASSLGAALVGTLYVLDEPSIGLHERDNTMLIRLLKELRDLGNTVVVVEHDRAMIEAADEVIDLGPMGGEHGGQILFQGSVDKIADAKESLTGKYLGNALKVEREETALKTRKVSKSIKIIEADYHNLKNISVEIPLHQMVVVTGVSGSGKSTLIYETLYNQFQKYRGRPIQELGTVRKISGFEAIDEVVLIDQSPIGRTPRSNPVTYLKAFDDIRKCFASTQQAKREGFGPGHFSFNVDGGRCPICKGDGAIKVEMHFLADVFMTCDACHGKRFKPEILDVFYLGKNIDEVLGLTIEEAIGFFCDTPRLVSKLRLLEQVGLGYLRLGQSATTLSGGEAQRLKLAVEMLERKAKHILYLFDEPTSGLHFHDIHYLMNAFDRLLAKGHSLVIIEHNMDVIRLADYIIDLGPEGGHYGGEVMFSGPVKDLLKCSKLHTGKHLGEYLKRLQVPSKQVRLSS